MIDRKDIVKTITLLKVTFPNSLKDLSEEELKIMIDVWYEDFKDTTKEDFTKAINEIRYTNKFFPSVADIKEKIAKSKTNNIPDAEEEWQEVLSAVRCYGSYREQEALENLNPYTAKIVKYIGYFRICTSTQEEQVWNKKSFIEEYNALKDKTTTELQIGNKDVTLLDG